MYWGPGPRVPGLDIHSAASAGSYLVVYVLVVLLEFDRPGWLGGDVIHDAAHAINHVSNDRCKVEIVARIPVDLVDDPVHDPLEEIPREVEGFGRHEVGCRHGAEDDDLTGINNR